MQRADGGVISWLLLFSSTPQSIRLAAYCQLPVRGAFWITTNQKLSPRAGKVSRRSRDERGMAQSCQVLRGVPPQLRLRSAERWLEYGRLAALPLAILPIPPDSPLAASPTGRARLESPASGGASWCISISNPNLLLLLTK